MMKLCEEMLKICKSLLTRHHEILLEKLNHYGARGKASYWFGSFPFLYGKVHETLFFFIYLNPSL